jgi:hypothetical protein
VNSGYSCQVELPFIRGAYWIAMNPPELRGRR